MQYRISADVELRFTVQADSPEQAMKLAEERLEEWADGVDVGNPDPFERVLYADPESHFQIEHEEETARS